MADKPNTEDEQPTATDKEEEKKEETIVRPNGMNPHVSPDGFTGHAAPTTEE